jgi:hypothetical protein
MHEEEIGYCTIQRGKGKKMHVEWKGYNSAREGKEMHVEWKGNNSARER